MGKLQTFAIRLDNQSAVFFSGQTLSGTVYAVVSDPMETRGIHLKISGHGQVRWTEHYRRDNKTVTRHYTASENYFEVNFNMLGNISGNSRQTLQAGEYNLPFHFVLPLGLPSSFEGCHGHVRYYCHAKIDLPWKFDPKCKLPITVNAVCDLNCQPIAAQPALQEGQKTLCCWCCKSGPISAVVRLERTGYVPGEAIHVNAEVNNHSTTHVTRTRAVLRALTTFHSTSKSKSDKTKLVEVEKGPIPPGRTDIWNSVSLLIPPIPPSHLGTCKIIDVEYYVEFEVALAGAHTNLSIKVPIIIGTIPLRSYFNNYSQQLPAYIPPPSYNEVIAIPSAPPLPDYPDLPPPSYMQTAFAEDNAHEDDEQGQKLDQPYKPTYPCYKPKLGISGAF